jgi:hypothetical protein
MLTFAHRDARYNHSDFVDPADSLIIMIFEDICAFIGASGAMIPDLFYVVPGYQNFAIFSR